MKSNIDRRGRVARAISGLLCICVGVVLLCLHWPESPVYRWVSSGILVAAGVFQLYEAKRGWCIARACGMKTPM